MQNKEIQALLKDVPVDRDQEVRTKQPHAKNEKVSAEQLKESGNKAFAAQDYEMSVHWYSLAIDVDSVLCEINNKQSALAHVLFSNRSAAYFQLQQYDKALGDAESTIVMAPEWPKGYMRKGAILAAMGRNEESDAAYEIMKKLEVK